MPSGEIARQAIEQLIADSPPDGCLRLSRARADDQVVLTETLDEATGVRRRMLTVSVEDENELALGAANAGLHRRTVALGVGVSHDQRARTCRAFTGRVT